MVSYQANLLLLKLHVVVIMTAMQFFNSCRCRLSSSWTCHSKSFYKESYRYCSYCTGDGEAEE